MKTQTGAVLVAIGAGLAALASLAVTALGAIAASMSTHGGLFSLSKPEHDQAVAVFLGGGVVLVGSTAAFVWALSRASRLRRGAAPR